ncbi:putative pathogenesis associated protein Cap20 [Eremomyces bilateralis CBS 781.70]|uniref:Pathogenesis associated protein Cap20 n=1 Tax=Eremomyces bilateralis CBS 781.70 TaxID=1392243 RepID=A0A6G1GEH1_9PEZI|nr:putative pathogenesis associated protein Cap20 [Eremomyces bilateralis CBS 781.70]KAF1816306.1 putative pathogenesis associated protein Cap20 [Eremomyces bilateralis CBS 781.70]
MPHAENETMNEKPLTNGEKPSSQFLSHLQSYPVVSDSFSTYKSHPWGAKSVDLASSTYEKSWPYLQGPFRYIAPYVSQIDQLADHGLTRVDSTFPQVKTPTDDIKAGVRGYVGYYLYATWGDEYQKTGEEKSLVHFAKAVVSTELKVAGDVLAFAKEWVQHVGKEAKSKADGAANSR